MELIPALGAIYQDDHPFLVIQKSAQVFASEFLINTALWAADPEFSKIGRDLIEFGLDRINISLDIV